MVAIDLELLWISRTLMNVNPYGFKSIKLLTRNSKLCVFYVEHIIKKMSLVNGGQY